MIPKIDLQYGRVHNDEILLYDNNSMRALIGCFPVISCNDRALLARCPKHIQSVFNLIVDILMNIHVMVN